MAYEPHGRYRISVHDRVVILITSGPHNYESFHSYTRDFDAVAAKMARSGPWSLLIISLKSIAMGPEAEELMRNYVRAVAGAGVECVAHSFEFLDEWKTLSVEQWTRVYGGVEGVPWRLFVANGEAMDWLAERGYPCSLSAEDSAFIEANR